MLAFLVALALLNAFLAGFHGSAAVVATVISSRALSPRAALLSAALAAAVGPLVLGTAVAATIGQQLVSPAALSARVILGGLLASTAWVLLTWVAGIPASASQALVGGFLGAATAAVGPGAVQWSGLLRTLVGLFVSPPLGLLAGLLTMYAMLYLARNATPRANTTFKQMQFVTALSLALVVSSNDTQKFMGLIALSLLLSGGQASFGVPAWVLAASTAAFVLGMLSGGYRLIRTLGARIFRIRPIHAFSAQLAATVLILASSLGGAPVSTTQIVSTAIVGVGSAERLSRVRWQVAANLVMAWVLTIPITALLGALSLWLLKGLIP